MPTDTGPMVPTASFRASSSPAVTSTKPVHLAPTFSGLKRHWPSWWKRKEITVYSSGCVKLSRIHKVTVLHSSDGGILSPSLLMAGMWICHLNHYLGLVRVGLLRVDPSVLLNVLEGVVHQTSITSHVAVLSGTVNQLLLTQRHQLPSLPEVLAFKRSGLKETFKC